MSVQISVRDGEIDLSMCELEEVPIDQIAAEEGVTSLDLSKNHLRSLGDNFTKLTHLTALDLSRNQLKNLPEDFGNLSHLKHLDLSSNWISQLPLTFGRLKNLYWLDLQNNPLVAALAEVAGPCQNAQQCHTCALRVVRVIKEAKSKLEEEQMRVYLLPEQESASKHRKEMLEKRHSGMKHRRDSRKHKKVKQKKSHENCMKHNKHKKVVKPKGAVSQSSNRIRSHPFSRHKTRLSFAYKIFKVFLLLLFSFALAMGFLYVLDYEVFKCIKKEAVFHLNNVINRLPKPVAIVGRGVYQKVNLLAALFLKKSNTVIFEFSIFMNKIPFLRDHWANFRDICSVGSALIRDFFRTLYLPFTGSSRNTNSET